MVRQDFVPAGVVSGEPSASPAPPCGTAPAGREKYAGPPATVRTGVMAMETDDNMPSRPAAPSPRASRLASHEWAAPGMRIGLLGGSFNPAHDGHRHISLVALRRLDLHEVWWLVSPQNPLKPAAGTADLGKRMASAEGVARHPRLVVTDIETRLGTRFTIDTLRALKSRFPCVHFVWLMGADNLVQLPRWKDWQELMSLVPVAVIDRPGYALKAQMGKAAARFRSTRVPETRARTFALSRPPAWIYLHARLNPISATEIRGRGGWP